ncbi:MAG: dynamin family protein [Candidatus Anammoxibacter sp.]
MITFGNKIKDREFYKQVIEILHNTKKYFEKTGNKKITKKVEDLIVQMEAPFYLLVAGEYNSGKSSFINALCGERILDEGPTPTTSKITLLTAGEKNTYEEIDDHLSKVTFPLDYLNDVTLIDTPGTNSIILEHKDITESFIHRAELVLFVISADHPLTESERSFLQFIRGKWGRKVLYILNKIDLKTNEEIDQILDFVEKNCYRLMGFEPKILTVSALKALEAKKNGDKNLLKESNIENVEGFIFDKLDLDTKIDFKLMNPLKYLSNVFVEIKKELEEKTETCNTDIMNIERFENRLAQKKQDMIEYSKKFKSEIETIFSRLKEKVENFINYNLTLRSVIMMKIAREKVEDKFKREVYGVSTPGTDLERILDDITDYISRNNRALWNMAIEYNEAEANRGRIFANGQDRTKEQNHNDRKSELQIALKERSKEYREIDMEREGERIRSTIQGGLLNFIVIECLAIGIGVGLTALLSMIVPPLTVITLSVMIACVGFVIFPYKRKSYRTEFFKRVDALSERFIGFIMFEMEKIIDRVIEDIQNSMAAYRDLRWSEREDSNKRIAEVDELLERVKAIIRKNSAE